MSHRSLVLRRLIVSVQCVQPTYTELMVLTGLGVIDLL